LSCIFSGKLSIWIYIDKLRLFSSFPVLSAYLAEGHESLWYGAASAARPSGAKLFVQTISSQESCGKFQPNVVGNILGKWKIRYVQIKGLDFFGAN